MKGFALELWVELHCDKPWVVDKLDNFHELTIGAGAREEHARVDELLAIGVVELVAVPMPLVDRIGMIGVGRTTAMLQGAWHAAKSHRTSLVGDVALLVQQTDDGMRSIFFELGRVCSGKANDVSPVFDYGALHAETDSKIGNPSLPRVLDCLDFSFNSPFAKTTRNQNPLMSRE